MKQYNSNSERQKAYRLRSKNVTNSTVTLLDLNLLTKRNLHRRDSMLHLINDPTLRNNEFADEYKRSLLSNMGGLSGTW